VVLTDEPVLDLLIWKLPCALNCSNFINLIKADLWEVE